MRGFGIDDISWYCIVLLVLSANLSATLSENGLLFQSCKALNIKSFAKKHENSYGHGGLVKDMIDDKDGDWWFSITHRIIQ